MKVVAGVKFTKPLSDGVELFRLSSRLLAKMQRNGMKIDIEYYRSKMKSLKKQIKEKIENLCKEFPKVINLWKKKYGKKWKLTSGDQLGQVLKHLGVKLTGITDKGNIATDEKTMAKVKHPFIPPYFHIKKIEKTITTIEGIVRESDNNGIVHPSFNLHIPSTLRSSCTDPNFQNFQVRDKEQAGYVRKGFISRFGKKGRIVEIDFKTLEVVIAWFYHKDPTMGKHLREGYDYHRNLASRIFMCDPKEVTKEMRYGAKNMFVFPQFYGSFYIDCAKNLWDYSRKLVFKGKPLREWLASKGIHKLGKCDEKKEPKEGTFEWHVKKVEDYFWNKEYPVYTEWKKRWYNAYLESGEVPMLSGFSIKGPLKRNQVINYPVQGAAFHCLLRTLIEAQKIIEKRKMRTVLISQIHDCAIADCPEEEYQEYINIIVNIVSKKLPKFFDWITIPLGCEVEVCPKGGTWFEKEEYVKIDGLWQPKSLAA